MGKAKAHRRNWTIVTNFDKQDFWIVSDLHLGHPLITAKRGFSTENEHDLAVLSPLYEVPEGSTLVCLGDISVRKDEFALKKLLALKSAKNLRMILTPGNHDACHPKFGIDAAFEWMPRYQQVFDLVVLEFYLRYQGKNVLFTHIPRLEDPFRGPKLDRWIARDGFDCVVHGHTHSSVPIDRQHVNVCLEATGLKPLHSSDLWPLVEKASA